MADGSYHFSEFELDRERFELRRDGRPLKLERIPLELLLLLVEGQGAIVSRLWGKDVFVDTEHGINTAVRKIRQTLKDDPENPRFVQTVTGKGYRFIAETNGQVKETEEGPVNQNALAEKDVHVGTGALARPAGAEVPRRSRAILALTLLVAIAAALTFLFRSRIDRKS